MESTKLEVGGRIKHLRNARQMTLREIGDKLKVAPNTVNRWERGESAPTRNNLIGLSNLFAVDPSWLMFGMTESNTKRSEEALIRKIRLLSEDQYKAVEKIIDCLAIIETNTGVAVDERM